MLQRAFCTYTAGGSRIEALIFFEAVGCGELLMLTAKQFVASAWSVPSTKINVTDVLSENELLSRSAGAFEKPEHGLYEIGFCEGGANQKGIPPLFFVRPDVYRRLISAWMELNDACVAA